MLRSMKAENAGGGCFYATCPACRRTWIARIEYDVGFKWRPILLIFCEHVSHMDGGVGSQPEFRWHPNGVTAAGEPRKVEDLMPQELQQASTRGHQQFGDDFAEIDACVRDPGHARNLAAWLLRWAAWIDAMAAEERATSIPTGFKGD